MHPTQDHTPQCSLLPILPYKTHTQISNKLWSSHTHINMNDLPQNFNLRKFKPHIKLPTNLNTRNFTQFQPFRTSPLNCSTRIYISNLPQKVNIRKFAYMLNIPHSTSKLFSTHLHFKFPTKLYLQKCFNPRKFIFTHNKPPTQQNLPPHNYSIKHPHTKVSNLQITNIH